MPSRSQSPRLILDGSAASSGIDEPKLATRDRVVSACCIKECGSPFKRLPLGEHFPGCFGGEILFLGGVDEGDLVRVLCVEPCPVGFDRFDSVCECVDNLLFGICFPDLVDAPPLEVRIIAFIANRTTVVAVNHSHLVEPFEVVSRCLGVTIGLVSDLRDLCRRAESDDNVKEPFSDWPAFE